MNNEHVVHMGMAVIVEQNAHINNWKNDLTGDWGDLPHTHTTGSGPVGGSLRRKWRITLYNTEIYQYGNRKS